MRRHIKTILIYVIILNNLNFFALSNELIYSRNTFIPRSFISYQYHDLIQLKNSFPLLDKHHKKNQVSLSLFTDYMSTMGKSSCSLGAIPFWSGSNRMTIGNNDGRAHLDAYQFGLGDVVTDKSGIAGIIEMTPQVEQIGTDFLMSYFHVRNNHRMFLKIHIPVGAMMMHSNLKELRTTALDSSVNFTQKTLSELGNPSSTINYQSDDYPVPGHRQKSILESFFGGVYQNSNPLLHGNIFKMIRLRKGRVFPTRQTIIRVGDIAVSLGYNLIDKPDGYFAASFKFSCPTGNVPTADYIFEPIFGRAGAWGVGFELFGLYKLWEQTAENKNITLSSQAELLHLSPGRNLNFRSFDLKRNGPGSKYLLVQNYIPTLDPDPLVATSEFMSSQRISPAINYTTLPVHSRIAVEGSFAAMIDYQYGQKDIAFGIEFWGRTQEKLSIDLATAVDLRYQNLNDFAVLGRQLATYKIDGQGFLPTYYCEPLARINKSQDPVVLVGTIPNVQEPAQLPEGIADARLSQNRIPSNLDDALDIEGAQSPAMYSGKLFCKLGYSWNSLKKIKKYRAFDIQEKNNNLSTSSLHNSIFSFLPESFKTILGGLGKKDIDEDTIRSQSGVSDTYDVYLAPRYIPTIAIITGVEFANAKNNMTKMWSLALHVSVNF